jgi:hypothetical protein
MKWDQLGTGVKVALIMSSWEEGKLSYSETSTGLTSPLSLSRESLPDCEDLERLRTTVVELISFWSSDLKRTL